MSGFVEIIDRLLPYATPGGEVHTQLTTLRAQVERGILLGPQARRYIAARLEEVEAVECRHLQPDGACRGIPHKGRCDAVPVFRCCDAYAPPPPVGGRGDPLRPRGGL